MTAGAADAAHVDVLRVIELHAETLEARKWFERARLHIRMTDGANRTFGIGELLRMASGAGEMI